MNGHVGNACIGFLRFPMSHSTQCVNVACHFVLITLPQESEFPHPLLMFIHHLLCPMLILCVLFLTMCILFDLCCGSQECEVVLMLVLPCHDLVEMLY